MESNLENRVTLKLEEASNGWIVRGSSTRGGDSEEYVFKDFKSLLQEISAIVSVLKQDPKQVTEEDLDEEEKRIEEDE